MLKRLSTIALIATIIVISAASASAADVARRAKSETPRLDIYDINGARLSDAGFKISVQTIEGRMQFEQNDDGTYQSPVALPPVISLEVTSPLTGFVTSVRVVNDDSGIIAVVLPEVMNNAPTRGFPSARRGGGGDQAQGVLPNDNCLDAIPVAVPSVTSGLTFGAAGDLEAGISCGTDIDTGGVWYSVTGTGNRITASTCPANGGSTDYNTRISIFCGECAALSCVDGNDNACSFFQQSTISWCSTAGTEYLILVHGAFGEQGAFDLSVFDDGAACNDASDCSVAPLGACCYVDGSCLDINEMACDDTDGVWQNVGTDCGSFNCASLTPENDNCVNSVDLTVPSVKDGSTIFATPGGSGADSTPCRFFSNSPTIWYSVTGTGRRITLTTCADDPTQPGAADYDSQIRVYCNGCQSSSCCRPNGGPSCDDATCSANVCFVDEFCCDTEWDSVCADLATELCPNVCKPTFCIDANDDDCGPSNPLASSVSFCSELGRVYTIAVTGRNATGNFSLSLYDSDVCNDPVPCEVCTESEPCPAGGIPEGEPDCGITGTDTVNGGCNAPIEGFGQCCTPGAGCDDQACIDAVVLIDPYCAIEWEPFCAEIANEACEGCPTFLFSTLACGDTICGTTAAISTLRDTDWYKLELTEETFIDITASSTAEIAVAFLDNEGMDDCFAASGFFLTSMRPRKCEEGRLTTVLPAGTWWAWVGPGSVAFSGMAWVPVECATDYVFSLTCAEPGGCCLDNGACLEMQESDCDASGGTFFGPGVDCYVADGTPRSYTSTPLVEVPDGYGYGVRDSIVVPDLFTVGHISIDMQISSQSIGDLQITLTHVPSGTKSALYRGRCEGGLNMDITFDDNGDVFECYANFPPDLTAAVGNVQPVTTNGNPLSTFNGLNAAGEWRLEIFDWLLQDFSTLNTWTLNIDSGTLAVTCDDAPCVGDVNNDGLVGFDDVLQVVSLFGQSGNLPADVDDDGMVGFSDILIVISNWGACP